METPEVVQRGPRLLLAGNGPYANRGCEAIVRGTVELLTRRFEGASFVLSSFGASRWEEAAGETDSRIEHVPHVDAPAPTRRFSKRWLAEVVGLRPKTVVDTRPFRAQVDALERCDCALLLGGDNHTLEYGTVQLYLDLNNALLETGKPVVLWGASVGPFTAEPEFETVMRDHLRRLTFVLARETATIEYLASIGVQENVRFVADPAFLMRAQEPELPDVVSRFLEQRPIGVNFSPLAGRYRPGGDAGWADLATDCVARAAESTGLPILLVPHVTIETSHDNDYRFLLSAGERVPGWGDRVTILPPNLTAAETKWVISRTRAFAGARMHAAVAALSALIPTLMLGYSMKYKGISRDLFGHEDWLIPVDKLLPEAFAEKLTDLLQREEEVRSRLTEVLPETLSRAESAAHYVAEALTPGDGTSGQG